MTCVTADSSIQGLEDAAKAHVASEQYAEGVQVYTDILDTFERQAEADAMRTVKCNRAQCYVKLGDFQLAEGDCREVLKNTSSSVSEADTLSAHFGLAQSLCGLGQLDEAHHELNHFKALNIGSGSTEEDDLRTAITRERQAVHDNEADSDNIRLRYEVCTPIRGQSQAESIVLQERVPAALCGTNVNELPRGALKAFLSELTNKHDLDLLESRDWGCWGCAGEGNMLVHAALPYLQLPIPTVVDVVLPVCEKGSSCHRKARKDVTDEASYAFPTAIMEE